MKILLSTVLIFLQLAAVAQRSTVTNAEFKALVGNWSGTTVNTVFINGVNQVSLATTLEVIDMEDSLQLNFVYTQPDGKQLTETNSLYVYDNSSKLSFDSAQFDIAEVRRRGVRLSIYAEREGYEDYKPVDFQDILLIGPGILNITKGVRSGNAVDFAIRKRLTLTKK
jgi:molybdenum cofactor biosynthesis enzyme MoaA